MPLTIVVVHRIGEALEQGIAYRFSGLFDSLIDVGLIVARRFAENPIGSGMGRLPNADPDAREGIAVEIINDRFHSVMGTAASAGAQTKLPGSQSHVIVNHNQIRNGDFEEVQ